MTAAVIAAAAAGAAMARQSVWAEFGGHSGASDVPAVSRVMNIGRAAAVEETAAAYPGAGIWVLGRPEARVMAVRRQTSAGAGRHMLRLIMALPR
jgi:hypothetical protein